MPVLSVPIDFSSCSSTYLESLWSIVDQSPHTVRSLGALIHARKVCPLLYVPVLCTYYCATISLFLYWGSYQGSTRQKWTGSRANRGSRSPRRSGPEGRSRAAGKGRCSSLLIAFLGFVAAAVSGFSITIANHAVEVCSGIPAQWRGREPIVLFTGQRSNYFGTPYLDFHCQERT